uniref:Glycosyltransferase N-terminal domain-containing protein n=1 Tax=Aegilops tauschii subsp. strangulata TaxID=200361 RepID=A0A453BSJ1_AEGTS
MGSEACHEKPHAVMIPYPAQGHVTPMMKMAKLLHARGFHVTFVNTEFNHRRLLRSRGAGALDGVPGFRFAAIPDGLPSSDADATQDVPALCNSTMTTCLPHLLALLARLNDPVSGVPPVTCLVVDGVMSFGYDAAKEIGVPCAALWTASACGRGPAHGQGAPGHGGAGRARHVRQHEAAGLPVLHAHHRPRRHNAQLLRARGRAPVAPHRRHDQHVRRAGAAGTRRHACHPPAPLHRGAAASPRPPRRPRRHLARRPWLKPLEGAGRPPRLARRPRRQLRGVRELRQHHRDDERAALGVRVGAGQQRLPFHMEHPAGPGQGRHGRAAAGVHGLHRRPCHAHDVVLAGEGPRAQGRGGVPDALRVELHAGEHLQRRADAQLALLRGAADQLQVQVHGVGERDGD